VKRVRHGEASIEVERPKVESVRGGEEDEAPQEEVEDVPRWPRLTRDEAMEYKGCDEDGRVTSRREKKEESKVYSAGIVKRAGGGEVEKSNSDDGVVKGQDAPRGRTRNEAEHERKPPKTAPERQREAQTHQRWAAQGE
jgi:hypothetical protein